MDDITRSLIALGASAAVNCRPCLQYHRAASEALGIPAGSMAAATEIGLRIGAGANAKTREFVADLEAGRGGDAGDYICTAAGLGEEPTCSTVDR